MLPTSWLLQAVSTRSDQSGGTLGRRATAVLYRNSPNNMRICEPDSHCVRLCKFAEIVMNLINPPWNQQPWGQFESTSPAMQWKPSTFQTRDKDTDTTIQKTPQNIDDVIAVEGSEVLPVGLPSMHFAGESTFGGYSPGQSVISVEIFSNYCSLTQTSIIYKIPFSF